ncbi:MAG: metallophosphoesterase [Candidatus Micrarchaeia archaeon]
MRGGSLRQRLMQAISERELRPSPEALDFLESLPNAEDFLSNFLSSKGGKLFLSREDLEGFRKESQFSKEDVLIDVGKGSFTPFALNVTPLIELSVLDSDVTGRSRCEGKVSDFVNYFKDRFKRLSRPLRRMQSKNAFLPLRDVVQSSHKAARVIGLVYSRKVTRNGHLLFEVEDENGFAPCLIPRDSELFEEGSSILTDEVVAFDVYSSNGLLIVKGFDRPGKIFQTRRKTLSSRDVSIAFLSDLHVGSKLFMKDEFQKFLKFLNGECSSGLREKAGKIKYLSIAGDLTDGIGIYPSQEKELLTKDILKNVPEHIEVIVSPGNHDAVRTAEPQPALSEDFVSHLEGFRNMHFVGNPSTHRVEGLELLIYHGTSADGVIANAPSLKEGYEFPERVARELLKKRHLCPIYGEDALVPESRDYLVIEDQPDLFHFGHVHKNGYDADFFGTAIVNSGTWQAQTDFQVRMGHVPSPCLLPIYDLKEGVIETLDFNTLKL